MHFLLQPWTLVPLIVCVVCVLIAYLSLVRAATSHMHFQPWALVLLIVSVPMQVPVFVWVSRVFNTTQGDLSNIRRLRQGFDQIVRGPPKDAQFIVSLIHLCEQMLSESRLEKDPGHHFILLATLGLAYLRLLIGDRTVNLERAITYFQEALRCCPPEITQVYYPEMQHNMGLAYTELSTGDRGANLERAITCYQEALHIWTTESDPSEHATAQVGLGHAYLELFTSNRSANSTDLERAITCYQEALHIWTAESHPYEHATTQVGLGRAYQEASTGDRTANLERAITCYQVALHFLTAESVSFNYAMTQNNLGRCYHDLLTGDRTANLERAITCYQEALRIWTPESAPFDYRLTSRNLANLYFAQGEWQAAFDTYQVAMLVGERLYRAGLSVESKSAEIAENVVLYRHAAFAAVRCGMIPEALLILEQGKTRLLAEALRLRIVRPINVPDEVWNAFEAAAAAVRIMQSEGSIMPSQERDLAAYTAREQTVQATNTALDTTIEHIRLYASDFLRAITLSDIHALLHDECTVLIAFCVTDQGSIAFVVSQNQEVQVVEIPTFTQTALNRLFFERNTDGEIIGGWLDASIDYSYEPTDTTFAVWQTVIPKTLAEIGQHLLAPVMSSLPSGTKRIIFLPSDKLFLLPLHAAPFSSNELDRLCDRYQVSYVPSIEVLLNIRANATREVIPQLYAVVNPEADPGLVFSLAEGTAIAKLFEEHAVDQGRLGTKQQVIESVRGQSYVHFSCHGGYNWEDPPESGLVLADGRLTLSDLQQGTVDLSSARLVTLSACETGMSDVIQGSAEEYVGISAGFLLSGVPCVISSLWSVPDLSTALLMERFYGNHLREGMDFAEALREAQVWVRELCIWEVVAYMERCYEQARAVEKPDYFRYLRYYLHQAEGNPTLRPFAHPYYWAAFTMNGL